MTACSATPARRQTQRTTTDPPVGHHSTQPTPLNASNYGEAGAIARYGRVYGIPHAYSGHNAFWRFGRPPDGARPIVVVGYHHPETLRGDFSGCVLSARTNNGVAIDNEEQNAPIWTCATTTEAWSRLWPRLHSLNP